MILQNNVTIFDFRVYLFARMCKVLMRAGRPGEIAKRGKAFVGSFARTIREYDVKTGMIGG